MSWYSREERQEQREDYEAFKKESSKAFELTNKQLADEKQSKAPRYPWHSTEDDFQKRQRTDKMKYTNEFIPSGYQVHVDSYENDGDNNQLCIISGLSENDMKFYVALALLFKGIHGNGYIKDEVFVTLIADVVGKHPDISDDVKEKFTANAEFEVGENADNIAEEVREFLGNPDDSYYDSRSVFVRLAQYIKVYYLPEALRQVDISELK